MYTIYGDAWDVEVKPGVEPINIAYSSASLDLHVDLAYYESPPGLQLLHCRRFDAAVVGGESTFVDGFFAAEELRRRDPYAFATLCSVPATFQKVHYNRAEPAHIVAQRPHFTLSPASLGGGQTAVTSITWAPPFEGPLRVPAEQVAPYYKAYAAFAGLLQELEAEGTHLIQFRMEPGDIAVFNNRRMLHGRRHFYTQQGEEGAQRSLQGCYVNVDEYLSRLRTLASRLEGSCEPCYRVGNGQLL